MHGATSEIETEFSNWVCVVALGNRTKILANSCSKLRLRLFKTRSKKSLSKLCEICSVLYTVLYCKFHRVLIVNGMLMFCACIFSASDTDLWLKYLAIMLLENMHISRVFSLLINCLFLPKRIYETYQSFTIEAIFKMSGFTVAHSFNVSVHPSSKASRSVQLS